SRGACPPHLRWGPRRLPARRPYTLCLATRPYSVSQGRKSTHGNKRHRYYPPAFPAEPAESMVTVKALSDGSTKGLAGQTVSVKAGSRYARWLFIPGLKLLGLRT